MSKQSEIGRDIKALRESQGYSQEWAALESNLSVTWWRQIEKGEDGCPNMSVDTLNCAAKTLGVLPWVLGVLTLSDEDLTTMIRKFPRMEQGIKGGQIGTNIVLLRKERKLTQKRLAQIAKISSARLRDIEHGCANTTVSLLERIAEAMEVPLLALSALTVSEENILAEVHSAQAMARMEAA
jgi:transcriptional regulator with XRE-family HTH domain